VRRVKFAVVGHVEWAEFVRVPRMPEAGEIMHATDWWEEPGGGGAVSVVQLAKLAGGAAFYTALGDDALGHRTKSELEARGVTVHAAFRPQPQRRVFVHLEGGRGERTITVIGQRMGPHGGDPLPWSELGSCDGVFFTAGDAAALQAARSARVLTATPRARGVLGEAGVRVDVLVGSARDGGEAYRRGSISPEPTMVVRTDGSSGGSYVLADGTGGSYPATPLPGPVVDTYGAGDSFAAALTFGLGSGNDRSASFHLAARCGAAVVTGRGPYAAQIRQTAM
jgi:ribokinase